jgi:transposase
VAQGSGLTRGDRNRNREVDLLRAVVRRDRAILAIDLGEDKQVAVVMDHDGRVLARKSVTVKAHLLGGLSAADAAMILAGTGDMRRFASARTLVKHSGLNPAERTSATMTGKTAISRRGRPGLRTAAWLAVWQGRRHNTVLAARYDHLTGRDTGPTG